MNSINIVMGHPRSGKSSHVVNPPAGQPGLIARLARSRSGGACAIPDFRRGASDGGPVTLALDALVRYAAALAVAHAATGAERGARVEAEAARDAALEDAAFLGEQLRSTRAFLAYVIEEELAAERAEREALLAEMAVLNEELQARARVYAAHAAEAPVSAGIGSGPPEGNGGVLAVTD